jgi:hypothetical protein
MVCRTCKRALERMVPKDGPEYWAHHQQDTLADHKADPVYPTEIGVKGRCDFCNQDLGDEKWVLPVRTFIAGRDPRSGRGQGFEGDWMACGICAPLIDGNRWSALLRRAQECWEIDHDMPAPEEKRTGWAHLYRLLRRNIIGSLHRV